MVRTLYAFVFFEDGHELPSTSIMRPQQTIIRLSRHHLEKGAGNVLDEVDSICVGDCQFCLFTKVHATRYGIDPDRIVPQEGGRHDNLSEFRTNAIHHVF